MHYFRTAWADVKHSRGWFGKLLLLGLISLIPIVGPFMVLSYLYGWAREIAWGTHEPLPSKIFANPDGKYWRRMGFLLVIMFVYLLIPNVLSLIVSSIESREVTLTFFGYQTTTNPGLATLQWVLSALSAVSALVLGVFAWVGSMRMAIYDRLSAGFQLKKIWKMMRHDSRGILKILGMYLILMVILGVIAFVFIFIVTFIAVFMISMAYSGFVSGPDLYGSSSQSLWMLARYVLAAGLPAILLALVFIYGALVFSVFINMMVTRALGYWVMQFEVPLWGGQDDPMPFELVDAPKPVVEQNIPPEPPVMAAPVASPAAPATEVGGTPVGMPAPAPAVAPAPGPEAAPAAAPAPAVATEASQEVEEVEVVYGEPMVVGAEFVLSSEQIEQLKGRNDTQDAPSTSEGDASEQDR